MRLRAKVGAAVIRGVTHRGRLVINGRDAPAFNDWVHGRVVFSDVLPRHERRQIFRRVIRRLSAAWDYHCATGTWPTWFTWVEHHRPGDGDRIDFSEGFDLSRPDPLFSPAL